MGNYTDIGSLRKRGRRRRELDHHARRYENLAEDAKIRLREAEAREDLLSTEKVDLVSQVLDLQGENRDLKWRVQPWYVRLWKRLRGKGFERESK